MNTSKKIKLDIVIAGEVLSVSVPEEQRLLIKETELNVQKKFSDLRRNFPRKSEKEIFAMIAFQFAFDFYEQAEQMNKALRAVEILDEDLGTLIGVDENKPK